MRSRFDIRSWEGILLRLSPTADGGAKLSRWDRMSKSWVPSDRLDKYMKCSPATAAELAADGVPAVDIAAVRWARE